MAVAGAAVALIGPNLGFGTAHEFSTAGWLFATVYMAEFDHTGLAALQLSLGAVSLVLAVTVAGLGVAQWRQQSRPLAAGVLGGALGLLALAWLTYQNVYALVPCDKLGLGLCDGAGGLVPGTWVQLNGVVWQVAGGVVAALGGLWLLTAPIVYSGHERFLRARMVWNGEIVAEHILRKPQPLTIGEDPTNLLQVAATGLAAHTLALPIGEGTYRIEVPLGATGALELNGHCVAIAAPSSKVMTAGDTMVLAFENGAELQLGFFAPQAGVLTPQHHRRDAELVASFTTLFSLAIVLFVVAASAPPLRDDSADREPMLPKNRGLIEVQIALPEVEQPKPELPPGPEADNKAPAKRASGEEGKLGDPREDPRKVTKIAKQDGPPRERINVADIGLAKALSAPLAPQGALGTVLAGDTDIITSKMAMAVADGGAETIIGNGSGGIGFRHIGSGGGSPEGPGFIRGTAFDLPGTDDGVGRKADVALGRKRIAKPGHNVVGVGETRGGCDKADIRKNVLSRAQAFRACYEIALLNKPDLSGKVNIQWTIGADGKVSGDKITSDTLDSSAVSDCVLRTVRRIAFAVPEAGVCVIAWPFVFNPN